MPQFVSNNLSLLTSLGSTIPSSTSQSSVTQSSVNQSTSSQSSHGGGAAFGDHLQRAASQSGDSQARATSQSTIDRESSRADSKHNRSDDSTRTDTNTQSTSNTSGSTGTSGNETNSRARDDQNTDKHSNEGDKRDKPTHDSQDGAATSIAGNTQGAATPAPKPDAPAPPKIDGVTSANGDSIGAAAAPTGGTQLPSIQQPIQAPTTPAAQSATAPSASQPGIAQANVTEAALVAQPPEAATTPNATASLTITATSTAAGSSIDPAATGAKADPKTDKSKPTTAPTGGDTSATDSLAQLVVATTAVAPATPALQTTTSLVSGQTSSSANSNSGSTNISPLARSAASQAAAPSSLVNAPGTAPAAESQPLDFQTVLRAIVTTANAASTKKPDGATGAEPSTKSNDAAASTATGPKTDPQSVSPLGANAPSASTSAAHEALQSSSQTSAAGSTGAAGDVDRVRFLQRVARAFQAADDQGGEIRLRLSPPELGSIKIQMAVRDGTMTAHLQTETETARTMLLDQLPALRDRLAEHNIKIDRFEVELMNQSPTGTPQNFGNSQGGYQTLEHQPRRTGSSAATAVNATSTTATARAQSAAGQLDVII